MTVELSIGVLLLITGLFIFLIVVSFGLQIYNLRTIRRLTNPMYKRIRLTAEQEAQDVLANARKQAEEIIASAHGGTEKLSAVYEQRVGEAQRIVSDAQEQAHVILTGVEEDRKKLASVYETQVAQAQQIVDDAQAQASAILSSAREQRAQVVDDYSLQIGKLQKVYEQKLAEHIGSLTQHIDKLRASQTKELTDASAELFESIILEHGKIRKRFDKVLTMFEDTQGKLVSESEQAVASVKDRLSETAETLSQQLHTYDDTIKNTIAEHIDHTYEVIDAQMEQYREARAAIMDRHIQQIVEDVVNKVLHKQLTIIEHAELAREALAQAKKDNLL